MKIKLRLIAIALFFSSHWSIAQELTDLVNPFIGTANYGATNPGALVPNGMMSVSPFNVMGSTKNKYDKDSLWWSTPYAYNNQYFTGYSHVNLSGVGCPDMGALLLMPTTGELNVNYEEYGSPYNTQKASPGYFSNQLSKYHIKTEVSATKRSSIARFTFPKGQANILFNLGAGLTNESGAWMRRVNATEIEGMKMLGTFCYHPQAVFPIYFVMRVNKKPNTKGYWKKQPEMPVKSQWDKTAGTRKLYTEYTKDIAGDDIGAYFTYHFDQRDTVEVQIGVSFVSIANARKNLTKEQSSFNFKKTKDVAQKLWENQLSKIQVKGGSHDQKVIFYTALYHALIHPNILNDVNGDYPKMSSNKILKTTTNRYTVFSLWDTYRSLHQLLTLLYPEKQTDMINSMVHMYKESGWLPRWELYGHETLTMEGDPAIPIIVDSWMKGLRNFDVNSAYKAMYKSATTPGKDNLLRPDIDDYLERGYIPLRQPYDNSVAHALEYYIADNALSKFADSLGKTKDADRFYKQSLHYKKYYSSEYSLLRPILPDGSFLPSFDPEQGQNFESSPGFHEGNSWSYSFMVPHDIKGLIKLHGGEKPFIQKLQEVFDQGYYDPTNEPDMNYPYLFSYIKGQEWRTQELTQKLLAQYFKNSPDGLPGNDDAGTMSTWAIFTMMGFYPDDPTSPSYTFTSPIFDEITLKLNSKYYPKGDLDIKVIRANKKAKSIERIEIDGQVYHKFRITHQQLIEAHRITFYLK